MKLDSPRYVVRYSVPCPDGGDHLHHFAFLCDTPEMGNAAFFWGTFMTSTAVLTVLKPDGSCTHHRVVPVE